MSGVTIKASEQAGLKAATIVVLEHMPDGKADEVDLFREATFLGSKLVPDVLWFRARRTVNGRTHEWGAPIWP